MLNLYCVGQNQVGSPARVGFEYLQAYLPEDASKFAELEFDWSEVSGITQWKKSASKLVTSIGDVVYDQTVVFVTTHSDDDRGDLFSGELSSMKVTEVS